MNRLAKGSNGESAMHTLRTPLVVFSVCVMAWSGPLVSATLVRAATPITRIACDRCEEADRFVRLQSVAEESRAAASPQFTHPVVLSPEDWTSLLTKLKVQRQAEGIFFRDPPGPVLPAFTPEEIGYLSTALSQAFAQAQPHEWVVFGLTRLNAYNMTEVTTGGWFLEGSALHLVLANYRKVVTMPSTRQLLWERPLRPDAGPAYALVAGHHQTIVRESSAISNLFSSAPSELSMAYPAMLVEEPVEASPSQELSAPPSETAPPTMPLEDRLRVLKRLLNEGLISEEEYRAKKQQLLDRF